MGNVNLFDRDEYIPDPADYEVREIRDLIDLDEKNFLSDREFESSEELLIDYKYNCEDLVDDLMGVNARYDFDINLTCEQLQFLDGKYFNQSFEKDDYGEMVQKDTLSGWVPRSNAINRVLFDAGHVLGLKNELGKYYRLLAVERFAQGVWQGKLENAVSIGDETIFEDVYEEMKVLRPRTYQTDFDKLVNGLFGESVDVEFGSKVIK